MYKSKNNLVEKNIKTKLRKFSSKKDAVILQKFFKTGPGQYGQGDIFAGIRVPSIRRVVKECIDLRMPVILKFLKFPIHEERLFALLVLAEQFKRVDDKTRRERIFNLYLNNTKFINNWDLVDLSAPHIVGMFLFDRGKGILYELAKSSLLWERRISIVATFYFIRNNRFSDTLKIATMLLYDEHDLIHKATGWMLREVGKRDRPILEKFLTKHYKTMPRTMLRYAIERFPKARRLAYLKGRI